jgi:hypothetical protein
MNNPSQSAPSVASDINDRWQALSADSVINRESVLNNIVLNHGRRMQANGMLLAASYIDGKHGGAPDCRRQTCEAVRYVRKMAEDLLNT